MYEQTPPKGFFLKRLLLLGILSWAAFSSSAKGAMMEQKAAIAAPLRGGDHQEKILRTSSQGNSLQGNRFPGVFGWARQGISRRMKGFQADIDTRKKVRELEPRLMKKLAEKMVEKTSFGNLPADARQIVANEISLQMADGYDFSSLVNSLLFKKLSVAKKEDNPDDVLEAMVSELASGKEMQDAASKVSLSLEEAYQEKIKMCRHEILSRYHASSKKPRTFWSRIKGTVSDVFHTYYDTLFGHIEGEPTERAVVQAAHARLKETAFSRKTKLFDRVSAFCRMGMVSLFRVPDLVSVWCQCLGNLLRRQKSPLRAPWKQSVLGGGRAALVSGLAKGVIAAAGIYVAFKTLSSATFTNLTLITTTVLGPAVKAVTLSACLTLAAAGAIAGGGGYGAYRLAKWRCLPNWLAVGLGVVVAGLLFAAQMQAIKKRKPKLWDNIRKTARWAARWTAIVTVLAAPAVSSTWVYDKLWAKGLPMPVCAASAFGFFALLVYVGKHTIRAVAAAIRRNRDKGKGSVSILWEGVRGKHEPEEAPLRFPYRKILKWVGYALLAAIVVAAAFMLMGRPIDSAPHFGKNGLADDLQHGSQHGLQHGSQHGLQHGFGNYTDTDVELIPTASFSGGSDAQKKSPDLNIIEEEEFEEDEVQYSAEETGGTDEEEEF